MTTDVFPVVPSTPLSSISDLTPAPLRVSGWMVMFYGAMSLALVLATMRLVWPPDQSRMDPTITVQ